MLAPWAVAHRRWKKRLAWGLYQRRDLAAAAALVASSAFEQRDILRHLPGARVEVIPNGCDSPPAIHRPEPGLPGGPETRWALALGRLHPVKGYAELIEAWSRVRPDGWKLAIAGPDENGYRRVLERAIRSHDLTEQVFLPGAADEARKWALLERCELFVAPSRTENFGMAIAEALQAGRPVLTTTGTPWAELADHGCGWWVEPHVPALEAALREATDRNPGELRSMGERGRQRVQAHYSWPGVAGSAVSLYRSILSVHDLGRANR